MRQRIFLVFTLSIFLVFIARLFFLQVVRGDFYYRKSENNRIQLIKKIAPRGRIYDCKGELLADNRPSFCAFLIPWLASGRIDETLENFNRICNIDVEVIKKKIKKQRFRPFQPVFLVQDLPPQIVSKILESGPKFPGIIIDIIPMRYYPNSSLAAHLLGYVQEISEKDLEALKDKGYEPGDLIGQVGIERTYESFLRGIDGGTEVEIDVSGKPTNPPHIVGEKEAIGGADIVLTIDKKIQDACESSLRGKNGAVIVMDPFNGDILGMASSPSFDLNIFTGSVSPQQWQRVVNNPSHPMLNRTIQSIYPPGSAFKIVVATAALEEGRVNPEEIFYCRGVEKAGKRVYKCWNHAGHGFVNFARGVAESCDIYFYHLGVRLGPEIIEKYAKLFGLGVSSGIEIGGEKSGVIPGPNWKKKVRKERWFLGDTLNFSIGQGYLLTTPLQMVNALNILFNGGKIYKPRLTREILFQVRKKFNTQLIREIYLKPSTVRIMKEALRLVVTRGTGVLANIPGVEVFGKTGTAQNPSRKDHAWFVGFAQPTRHEYRRLPDSEDKPVTIVVFIENGGNGGKVACPIARNILCSIYQKPYYKKISAETQTIKDTGVMNNDRT